MTDQQKLPQKLSITKAIASSPDNSIIGNEAANSRAAIEPSLKPNALFLPSDHFSTRNIHWLLQRRPAPQKPAPLKGRQEAKILFYPQKPAMALPPSLSSKELSLAPATLQTARRTEPEAKISPQKTAYPVSPLKAFFSFKSETSRSLSRSEKYFLVAYIVLSLFGLLGLALWPIAEKPMLVIASSHENLWQLIALPDTSLIEIKSPTSAILQSSEPNFAQTLLKHGAHFVVNASGPFGCEVPKT